MPEWQQIQHILVISDRTISLVNYNRPIVFLFAASRSFESLLRMSEYFGNTSALMCCVLGALHLVFGILLHVRVVAGVFCFRPKEVGVFSVEVLFARCPKFDQVGRLLAHRYRLLFSMCGIYCSKSSGVYWAGIFHVEWISGRRFNYTCVCCIPPQFWNAWS